MEFSDSVEVRKGRWRTTKFVPRRYEGDSRRYCFIIGSVVVALVLVISVILVITNSSNTKPTQKAADVKIHKKSNIYSVTYDFENTSTSALANLRGKLVLLVNGTELTSLDCKSQKLNSLHRELDSVTSAFDVHVDKYIYWIKRVPNVFDEDYVVERYAWIKGEGNFTVEKRGTKVTDLAVDRVTKNLYAINEDVGNVFLIDLLGSSYITLKAGLVEPRKIVLDPEEGLMFVLQHSRSIVRANMDGSQLTEIVTNNVTALEIDTNHKRVYWVNNNFSIESSDYEGKKLKSLFVDIVKIETLAVLDDRLFWTWPSFGNTTNMFSCEIDANCMEHSTYNVPGNVTSIRGYGSAETRRNSNPCDVGGNAGCEHLCFISGKDKSRCACREGWLLNADDRRTCDEALIFA